MNKRPNVEKCEDDGHGSSITGGRRSSHGGGGGAGMSRAAMKRAKKRAKTAAAVVTSTSSPPTSGAAAATSAAAAMPSNKMQIPLDGDDGDGDTGSDRRGGEDFLGAVQQYRMDDKKGKKKKKKKTKTEKMSETNTEMATNKASPAVGAAAAMAAPSRPSISRSAAATGTAKREETEEMDVLKAEAAVEMEPELEALLSTLTPLQILLLDDDANDGVPCDDEPADDAAQELSHETAAGPEEREAALASASATETHRGDDGAAASPLAGIDPRGLIGDLTTAHRAHVLLSSLLAPAGVTLHDFYARYWGKRPLLACLDQDEEERNSKGEADEEAARAAALRHATRLDGFLHRPLIEEMIAKNKLRYGLDLNVTRFTDTMGNGLRHRITLDPPPKKRKARKGGDGDAEDLEFVVANPTDVWSNVDTSHCTLRLLRPHEHNDTVHALLSLLESELGCMAGSNAYLTPLHSQGFAPHYDDVDVFLLQLEGYKRWRVYAPFATAETLPRVSSRDYTEKEVEERAEGGEALLDVVLGPGDVLYLPRGWIHQAETVRRPAESHPRLPGRTDAHSLHLTVSAMQNWCWADFLEVLLPDALQGAASSDKSLSLREGLPRNFVGYMGTMHQPTGEDSGKDGEGAGLPEGLKQVAAAEAERIAREEQPAEESDDEAVAEAQMRRRTVARRTAFKNEAKKRIMRVCKHALSMLDDACDVIGVRFLGDRLPPALLAPERRLTKAGAAEDPRRHDAAQRMWPNTLCRLVRPHVARLVVEGDKAVVYHCFDNARAYRGAPLSPLEFELDDAPALEQMLTTVEPRWIMVKDLIHGDVEDKMELAQALFDEGILATMLVDTPDRSVQVG